MNSQESMNFLAELINDHQGGHAVTLTYDDVAFTYIAQAKLNRQSNLYGYGHSLADAIQGLKSNYDSLYPKRL